MEAAVSDLVKWEPGETIICVLCDREHGGDDPPGPWFRHRPTHRRRIPIFDTQHGWRTPLGYLVYVMP